MTPAEPRKLILATVAAVLVASFVLVAAVLPAEYGIDPTGLGSLAGFTRLNAEAKPGALVETPLESGPLTLYEMRATWRLGSFPLASQEGYLTTARTQEIIRLPLNVTNLTSVTATLEWNDTDRIEGQPTMGDTFELSIRAPGGLRSQHVQATNDPGQPGNLSVTLNLRSVPFPEEDSTGIHIPAAEDTSGVGNWTFVVRLYTAGGLEGSQRKDPGNNWTLTVTGEAYELDVKKQVERAGDRVKITLNPKQGLEYKFIMHPNATLGYRWESSAPVYWDFHAEEEGKDPDDFIRYEQGTSTGEEGTLIAPFAGRHGWYWSNDGAVPVTITLETRGEYTILGVPP